MDFRINEEQRAFVETVRRICQKDFKARAVRYLDGTWPAENMKQLAEIGVLGMAVPQEYGGSGLGILDTVLVLEEIGKVCYVTAMAALGEVGVQTRILSTYAPESIKRRVLTRVCSGEAILAICMTEPDAGTDVPNYKTNTDIKGDRVVLNGVKTLISRADIAEMLVVFTRVNRVPGAAGIGCVLVPGGVKGFSARASFHTMGGENLCEVVFDNVELPLENLVLRDNGMKRLLSAFNTQRCLNPAICLGLAEGALEEAVRYLRERSAFGHKIGDFQGLRWKAADMLIEIEAGRGLLYRAAVSGDPFPDPMLAAMAKIYCNEMSIRVTSEAVQVHGGYGFTDEFPVSRFFRGSRYGSLGGGTTETLRNLVGKKLVEEMDLATGVLGLRMF
ncbi:MAG TPA: acyl-CoA dehydrogenase family protein [Burkholderiales bacterium]|jgi:alkylation response protein AidB-like acyl-CoA dehydrogenase|nr:acyl-CoA dehydrogenase family protein [Burkholderiales bacterium]